MWETSRNGLEAWNLHDDHRSFMAGPAFDLQPSGRCMTPMRSPNQVWSIHRNRDELRKRLSGVVIDADNMRT